MATGGFEGSPEAAVVTTEFLDAPFLESPIEFKGGKWVTKIQQEMKGI